MVSGWISGWWVGGNEWVGGWVSGWASGHGFLVGKDSYQCCYHTSESRRVRGPGYKEGRGLGGRLTKQTEVGGCWVCGLA